MKAAGDWASVSALEWLETNGIGGYALGTVSGAGTRGYHGLLCAADPAPGVRTMLVTTLDERLLADPPADLSCHQYPGVISPEGYRLLESFEPRPFPTWCWRTPTHRVERTLFMVQGENTTVVRYRLLAGPPVRLAVRPFFVFRDHHAQRHESGSWWVAASRAGDAVHCVPSDGGPAVTVYGRGDYREDPQWYRRFEYAREQERGLPSHEDAYAPFVLQLSLSGEPADLVFTADPLPPRPAGELEDEERARRAALAARGPLALGADQFLVLGAEGRHSVIAGYPWFTDWGRDTMIALPGLALATGQFREAWLALEGFAAHLRKGILPNRFPDGGGAPEYNTVDAALWLAVAVWRLGAEGSRADPTVGRSDGRTVRASARPPVPPVRGWVVDALRDIESHYARGTDYGIREDADGLITAGAPGVALTWMDARVGDWVVTPRRGKPVEINALWYNLRMVLAALLESGGRPGGAALAADLRARAERTRESFAATFPDERTGGLVDVVAPDGSPDRSVRPNQVFAAALPFPVVDRDRGRAILAVVERELLTPMGLRTLAPGDPAYRGRYGGDQRSRDAAYHQGTVWPWLLGPWADSVRYVEGDTVKARQRVQSALAVARASVARGCLGQVAEIADGDAPHDLHGCPAQAWSVAEVARAAAWADGAARGRARARGQAPVSRRRTGK